MGIDMFVDMLSGNLSSDMEIYCKNADLITMHIDRCICEY